MNGEKVISRLFSFLQPIQGKDKTKSSKDAKKKNYLRYQKSEKKIYPMTLEVREEKKNIQEDKR